jgi:ATP-dependent protease ClpP protease subunit
MRQLLSSFVLGSALIDVVAVDAADVVALVDGVAVSVAATCWMLK